MSASAPRWLTQAGCDRSFGSFDSSTAWPAASGLNDTALPAFTTQDDGDATGCFLSLKRKLPVRGKRPRNIVLQAHIVPSSCNEGDEAGRNCLRLVLSNPVLVYHQLR